MLKTAGQLPAATKSPYCVHMDTQPVLSLPFSQLGPVKLLHPLVFSVFVDCTPSHLIFKLESAFLLIPDILTYY